MNKKQMSLVLTGAGLLALIWYYKKSTMSGIASGASASTPLATQSTVAGTTGNPFAVGNNAPPIPQDYSGNTWGDPNGNNYWVKNKAGNWIQA